MISQNPYHLGRTVGVLGAPFIAENMTFAAERFDQKTIESAKYEHCTFTNLSFKEANLKNGTFINCIFIGCYFRRAVLSNCRFIGCRFLDCNFSYVALKSCDFRYALFRGCQIPYSELEYSLPSEPNLREDLARNLSLESSRLGLSQEARYYRMAEIRAHERHLKSAFLGSSKWYRDHFDGLRRSKALLELILSLMNRWLWGYGERAIVLIRNLLLLSLIVFPVSFYYFREQLSHSTGKQISILDTLYYSLANVVPSGVVSNIVAIGDTARILAGLESLFGVVAIALFAAYIFRWSLHR